MMPKQKSALGSPSNSLQVNGGNLYGLCKDLDKFTRYFIIKAVQVIVQSRLGGGHKMRTECKPSGNDWFNINISDIVEISDKTKAVLNAEGLSVKLSWRICCEISLKTNDGSKVVLEHWIISNKSHLNSSQKLNNSGQASPRSNYTNNTRCLNTHLSSSNTSNGTSPLNTINTSSSRVRTALFTSSSRNRLNSIGDSSSGDNYSGSTKLLMGITNENIDIKPSTSCFTLSSAQTANNDAQSSVGNSTTMASSPSTYSLNTNTNSSTQNHQLPASNNNSPSQQKTQQQNPHGSTSTSKPSANSSIYTIYNRMSLLLKTLLTTTHVVPAYRLASRASQSDSCVICYRVYSVPRPSSAFRGSIEDINSANASESPNKRSLSSTSSLGSLDIREFVSSDELDLFCPILKLGSVKTDVSEMDISVCYRTDIRGSNFLPKTSKTKDMYNRILDVDCLTAAKQLLAGNDYSHDRRFNHERHSRNGSQNSLNNGRSFSSNQRTLDFLDQPLRPAFALSASGAATTDRQIDGILNEQAPQISNELSNGCDLIESAFDGLLKNKYSPNDDDLLDIASNALKSPLNNGNQSNHHNGANSNHARSNKSVNAQSEPIQVPSSRRRNQTDHHSNLSPGSTPKSLTDSYVFVDLNPPFASDEQNDINSFFHGPSPSFSNGSSNLKDVEELTSQLANFEANASQIDDFVDNMCASEDEELEEEEEAMTADEEKGENDSREEDYHLCPKMGRVLERE